MVGPKRPDAERLLVPELPAPVEGERGAARARRGASGCGSWCGRTRRRACSPTTATRWSAGRRSTRAPTRTSPATARSRTSTTSTCGRCGASACVPGTGGTGISHPLVRGAVEFARAHGAPAVEGYPVDNEGRKVDQTMAYVGTRRLFERAGFAKAADTESVTQRLPPRAHAAGPAVSASGSRSRSAPPTGTSGSARCARSDLDLYLALRGDAGTMRAPRRPATGGSHRGGARPPGRRGGGGPAWIVVAEVRTEQGGRRPGTSRWSGTPRRR